MPEMPALSVFAAAIAPRRVLQRLHPIEEQQRAVLADEAGERAAFFGGRGQLAADEGALGVFDLLLRRRAACGFARLGFRRLALEAEEGQRGDIERVGVALAVLVGALAVERPDEHALRAAPAAFLQQLDEMADERGLARAADGVERHDVAVRVVPGFEELRHFSGAAEKFGREGLRQARYVDEAIRRGRALAVLDLLQAAQKLSGVCKRVSQRFGMVVAQNAVERARREAVNVQAGDLSFNRRVACLETHPR